MFLKHINEELFGIDPLKYNALKFNSTLPLIKTGQLLDESIVKQKQNFSLPKKDTLANINLKNVKNLIKLPSTEVKTEPERFEENKNSETSHTQDIVHIGQKIQQGKSDLIKRKLSGYLYADNSQKELFKKLRNSSPNKLNLREQNRFGQTYIQIQGPKGLIHSKFKQVSSSENKIFQQYFNSFNTNLKNYELLQNQTYFGAPVTDFGVAYTKPFDILDLDLKSKEKSNKDSINQKKPVLDLSEPVVRKRSNAKAPFAFWKNPENKWWLGNNNLNWLANKNFYFMTGLNETSQPTFSQTNDILLGRIKSNASTATTVTGSVTEDNLTNFKHNQNNFLENHNDNKSLVTVVENMDKLKAVGTTATA